MAGRKKKAAKSATPDSKSVAKKSVRSSRTPSGAGAVLSSSSGKENDKVNALSDPKTAVGKVVSVVKSVKKSTKSKFTKAELKVFGELEDLARYIQKAKDEIGQIRPDDVKDEFLPRAVDELDAVVEAAADATNAIMDACEVVESVLADVPPEVSEKLMNATTSIYEACTFQDITGQRINKVVKTMHHIEQRIDDLMTAFGDDVTTAKKTGSSSAKGRSASTRTDQKQKEVVSDDDLLEGPQLGDKAKNQLEIDALLASFD